MAQAIGYAFGVVLLMTIMAAVGVFAAFLVYLYPIVPWGLRVLAAAEAVYFACLALSALAWIFSPDFRRDERWMLLACATMFIVLWMYNGLMLHLAGSWGIELDSFSARVLGFAQASIDWSWGIVSDVVGYVAGFFVVLAESLLGLEIKLPDLAVPSPRPALHRGESYAAGFPPPVGDLGPVVSWAVESVWSLVLGVVSGWIGLQLFRRRA